MSPRGLTLVLPDKADPERDAVATAWQAAGGTPLRLARFWEPPPLLAATTRVYGNDSFCLVLEQKLGLALMSPADDLLLRTPPELLARNVWGTTLATIADEHFPVFVKSIVPKLIRSRVYASADEVIAEAQGLPGDTQLLASELVAIAWEARTFVKDGAVLDCAIYEGEGDVATAREMATRAARSVAIPRAVVIDIAGFAGDRVGVLEYNAAWGAGLNGCDATRVLPAIESASAP